MIGSIIRLTANDAARPERSKPRISTHVAKMKRPAMIDGSAVIAVTTDRTSSVNRPRVSVRNTAHPSASGTVMINDSVMMISVPTMACLIPPTVSGSSGPASLMSCVYRLVRMSASRPFQSVNVTTEIDARSRR